MSIFYPKCPASWGIIPAGGDPVNQAATPGGICERYKYPWDFGSQSKTSQGLYLVQGIVTGRRYYLILWEENPRNKRMSDFLRVSWGVHGRNKAGSMPFYSQSMAPCCLLTKWTKNLLALKGLCSCHSLKQNKTNNNNNNNNKLQNPS